METKELIELLLKQVVAKLNIGEATVWKDSQFQFASEEIFRITNERISKMTLKRMLGKIETDDDYTPQPASLDILARYIGIESFYAFTKKQNSSDDLIVLNPNIIKSKFLYSLVNFLRKNVVHIVIYSILILFALKLFSDKKSEIQPIKNIVDSEIELPILPDLSPPEFIIHDFKKVGSGVAVEYLVDIKNLSTIDGNFMLFSDKSMVSISNTTRNFISHTYPYNEFGYYLAKLFAGNKYRKSEVLWDFYYNKNNIIYRTNDSDAKKNIELKKKYEYSINDLNLELKPAHIAYDVAQFYPFHIPSNKFTAEAKLNLEVLNADKVSGEVVLNLRFEAENLYWRLKPNTNVDTALLDVWFGRNDLTKIAQKTRKEFLYDPNKPVTLKLMNNSNRLAFWVQGEKRSEVELKNCEYGYLISAGIWVRNASKIKIDEFVVTDGTGQLTYDILSFRNNLLNQTAK